MNLAVLGLGGGEVVLVFCAILAFWGWMLISAIGNKGLSDNERICWVIAIVCAQLIGALLYLVIVHSRKPPPRMEGA